MYSCPIRKFIQQMKTTSNIVRSFVFRYKLLRALTCLIIISCTDNRQHTTKKVLRATEQKPEYQLDSISLQTGACEGTCPVYALTLFANNTARFEGGAFVPEQVFTKPVYQAAYSIASHASLTGIKCIR